MSPYVSADTLYRKLTLDPSAVSVRRQSGVTDMFAVSQKSSVSSVSDGEEAPLHVNDNSCLPSALVLGE